MKRRNGRMLCLIALANLSLISCRQENFSVQPDLASYSDGFAKQAIVELSKMGPPCERDKLANGCSTVHRMILDYSTIRDQVRAIKKEG